MKAWTGLLAAVAAYHEQDASEKDSKQMGLSAARALSSFNTHGFYSTSAELVMTQMIIHKVQNELKSSFTDESGEIQKQLLHNTPVWGCRPQDVFFPLSHTVAAGSQDHASLLAIAKHIAPSAEMQTVECLSVVLDMDLESRSMRYFSMSDLSNMVK